MNIPSMLLDMDRSWNGEEMILDKETRILETDLHTFAMLSSDNTMVTNV